MAHYNRRRFLKDATALGFASGAGLLGAMGGRSFVSSARAATPPDYKALVCLFFKGGHDGADMLLPMDAPSHAALRGARRGLFESYGVGSGASSRDRENLLELVPATQRFEGRRFGLPPAMAGLRDVYDAGNLAVVGNVGPLVEPTTRTTMENNVSRLPRRLFSHNDQQATWMSMGVEGAGIGWGGQFADAVLRTDSASSEVFTAISMVGHDLFLAGRRTQGFPARTSGPGSIDILNARRPLGSGANGERARELLRRHFAGEARASRTANLYMRDLISANSDTFRDSAIFAAARERGTPLRTGFVGDNLGQQLRSVAEIVALRDVLGVRRQIFYVAVPGFDTHNGQAKLMGDLQTKISQGLASFQAAMDELGTSNEVTLFTASDFGRTTIANDSGTDHGWGGHQLVMGGAVRGGDFHGDVPAYDLGLDAYTKSRGRLIPSVSVDQYAATLGRWFGLADDELLDALPNLGNFVERDLGFMG